MLAGLSNLQQRVISAVILVAIVLLATWLGGAWFRLMVCLVALAVFLEWLGMTQGEIRPVAGPILAAFGLAVLFLLAGAGPTLALLAALVLGAAAGVIAETRREGLWILQGFAYAFLPAYALILLRADNPAGLTAVLFLYAVVWVTDIGAYFVGRQLRGPKLAPAISPGKTWSGAIGGLALGVLAGMIIASLAGAPTAGPFIAAILLSITAQLGDLYESSLKRRANVKDSSELIPGHGGMMDRIDGLAFAAITLLLFSLVAHHPGAPASELF